MSAKVVIPENELIEIPSPYPEPRVAYQNAEPRKSNNLTLIDGKTFLSPPWPATSCLLGRPIQGSSTMTRVS